MMATWINSEWPFYAAQLCVRTVDFRGLLAKLLRVATYISLL